MNLPPPTRWRVRSTVPPHREIEVTALTPEEAEDRVCLTLGSAVTAERIEDAVTVCGSCPPSRAWPPGVVWTALPVGAVADLVAICRCGQRWGLGAEAETRG